MVKNWMVGSSPFSAAIRLGPRMRARRRVASNSPLVPRRRIGSGASTGTVAWSAGSKLAPTTEALIATKSSSQSDSTPSAWATGKASTSPARSMSATTMVGHGSSDR